MRLNEIAILPVFSRLRKSWYLNTDNTLVKILKDLYEPFHFYTFMFFQQLFCLQGSHGSHSQYKWQKTLGNYLASVR